MGCCQNISTGPVVLLQLDDLCLWKIPLKTKNVADVRTPPLVNTLVIIADDTQIFMSRCQHFYNLILDVICILVLVHHDVLKPLLIVLQYRLIPLQHVKSIYQKIVKVHGIVCPKLLLIFPINQRDLFRLGIAAVQLHVLLRRNIRFLLLADNGGNVGLRVLLCVQVHFLQNVLDDGFLIHRVVDHEVFFVARHVIMFPENPQTHGVEGEDPHVAHLSHQLLHPLTHLSGCLIGEGHRQNIVRADPLFDEISDPAGHGAGLSRSCAGQNEKRPLHVGRRLQLLFI